MYVLLYDVRLPDRVFILEGLFLNGDCPKSSSPLPFPLSQPAGLLATIGIFMVLCADFFLRFSFCPLPPCFAFRALSLAAGFHFFDFENPADGVHLCFGLPTHLCCSWLSSDPYFEMVRRALLTVVENTLFCCGGV